MDARAVQATTKPEALDKRPACLRFAHGMLLLSGFFGLYFASLYADMKHNRDIWTECVDCRLSQSYYERLIQFSNGINWLNATSPVHITFGLRYTCVRNMDNGLSLCLEGDDRFPNNWWSIMEDLAKDNLRSSEDLLVVNASFLVAIMVFGWRAICAQSKRKVCTILAYFAFVGLVIAYFATGIVLATNTELHNPNLFTFITETGSVRWISTGPVLFCSLSVALVVFELIAVTFDLVHSLTGCKKGLIIKRKQRPGQTAAPKTTMTATQLASAAPDADLV